MTTLQDIDHTVFGKKYNWDCNFPNSNFPEISQSALTGTMSNQCFLYSEGFQTDYCLLK
jgi:hypothetical protein